MKNDNKAIDFENESLHTDGKPKGLIFAVSAPSGTGKTTLCSMLLKEFKDIKPSISFTTRSKRAGEIDGISYHFISDAEFESLKERLKNRGGLSDDELNKRLITAYEEIKQGKFYDYIITNDDLNDAYSKLKSIVIAERCRNLNKFKT